jgi:hypothetical protein
MIMPTGRAKVLDFGLARHLPAAPADETRADHRRVRDRHGAAGTIGYMAPEQIEGRPADARSDVFALGVVMFELLTGDRPFKGDTAWATMNATMNSDAPDLGRIRTDVPPGLVQSSRARSPRKPEHRYASAGDLSIDLKALRASLGTAGTRHPSRRHHGAEWRSPARWWLRSEPSAPSDGCGSGPREPTGCGPCDSADRARICRPATSTRRIERARGAGDSARRHVPAAAMGQYVRGCVAHQRSSRRRSRDQGLSFNERLASDWRHSPHGKVPFGLLRWRLTRPGYEPLEISAAAHQVSTVSLVRDPGRQMVFVARGDVDLDTGTVEVPDYWIDKYEVTNRQFKEFVDGGGYRNRDYCVSPSSRTGARSPGIRRSRSFATRRDSPAHPPGRLARIRRGRTAIPSAA